MSRAAWEALIEGAQVRVNGRVLRKPGGAVEAGASVQVAGAAEWGLLPAAKAAELLWLDARGHLGLFRKECGVDSVALLPWDHSAFANQVARFLEDQGRLSHGDFARLAEPPHLEGGLLQRLDRDTSGILCVAFDSATKALFRGLFSHGAIEKTYRAIVVGELARIEGTHRLCYRLGAGAKVEAFASQARPNLEEAAISVRICKSSGKAAEVEVLTSQGLRHVVRAGLAALGAPLVGDSLYGGSDRAPFHQLHASRLVLRKPELFPGFPSGIEAPPPQSFLDSLRGLGLN